MLIPYDLHVYALACLPLIAVNPLSTEVSEWECDDVCQWMTDLGLKDYDAVVHSNKITGKVLLELQTEDFLVRIHTPIPNPHTS